MDVEFEFYNEQIELHQRYSLQQLFDEYIDEQSKSKTPLPEFNVPSSDKPCLQATSLFGSLLYIAQRTQPDIFSACQFLSIVLYESY